MTSKKNNMIYLAGYGIIFILVLFMNLCSLPTSDEWSQYPGRPVEGFGWDYAISTYFTWNARIGEILMRMFLWNVGNDMFQMHKIFAIVNTFVSYIFLNNYFYIIKGHYPKLEAKNLLLFYTIFILIYYSSYFYESFVWQAGAMGYGWAMFFYSCFALPYAKFLHNIEDHKKHKAFLNLTINTKNYFHWKEILKALLLMIISIPIGMGAEISGAVILIGLGIITMWLIFIKKTIPPLWFFMGGVGLFAGWLLLYFAPGPNLRATNNPHIYQPIKEQKLIDIISRFTNMFKNSYVYYHWVILGVFIITSLKEIEKDSRLFIQKNKLYILYLFLGLVGMIVGSILIYFPQRTYITFTIFLVLASLLICKKLIEKFPNICSLIIILVLINTSYVNIVAYLGFNQVVGGHFKEIEKQKSEGIRDIEVRAYRFHSPIIGSGIYIDWVLESIARVYEVDSIKIIDP